MLPPKNTGLDTSPASIMGLKATINSNPESKAMKHDIHLLQQPSADPRTNIASVMERLESSLASVDDKNHKKSAVDQDTETRKRRTLQVFDKPKPVRDQSNKRRKKDTNSHASSKNSSRHRLPPPTLASCNRQVLGAHLRLPRTFTSSCPQKSAIKYARMAFPFSDRHLCALVPTALFSYCNIVSSSDTKSISEREDTADPKPKYSHRRRVWLLVPHKQAPADLTVNRVLGPPEPNVKC